MRKVSVIMNSYRDSAVFLKQAIESYMSQEGVDVHLILSTVKNDSSIDVIKNISGKITVVENEEPGIYSQINNAIQYIDSDFYCYASGNDVSIPSKLKDESDICSDGNNFVCYSAFILTDKTLKPISVHNVFNYNYKKHLGKNNFVSDCAMVRSDILKKYMPFRLQYRNHAYHDLWLRIAEGEGERVFICNKKPEWFYRVMPTSLHIRRKKSKQLQTVNSYYQKNMLASHGVKI